MTLQQLNYVLAIADYGSINAAAGSLYISQPTLSEAVKELEQEIGVQLFIRSNRGVKVTAEGQEFLGYARQLREQYGLIETRYIDKRKKDVFSVSMQHYSFAVESFVDTVKDVGIDTFDFSVRETTTQDVILDVRNFRSEIGVIYMNDFNGEALKRLLDDNGLEFVDLFGCDTYVYLWKGHPLAIKEEIDMEELEEYPCLSFDQGSNSSLFLAEEMKSTVVHKRLIHANDRATMLNLMKGLNAYTLCSGIISEDLNGNDYLAVPLKETEEMRIGYIKRKGVDLSKIAQIYVEELKKYENMVIRRPQ